VLDAQLPGYGFGGHKGYGTAAHYQALRNLGPSPQHRCSFRPLAEYVTTGHWPERAGVKGKNDVG
jgi:ribonuclease HII